MQKRTLGIAAALLSLGAAAFGQDPLGNGLPERPSVPGPHDDAVSNYNAQNNAADTSQQSLSSDLNALTADSPLARQYNAAIGEYKSGSDDQTDEAIAKHESLIEFLSQPVDEVADFEETVDYMMSLA